MEANKAVVKRSHKAVWPDGRVDVIDSLYTDDFVCHFVIGPEWRGRNDLAERAVAIRTGFPDWREEIQRLVAEGDYVASHFESTGTHLGNFRGLAPTGRQVRIQDMAIYRLVDGKIAEQWGLPDIHGMNVQLGIVESEDPVNGSQPVRPETNRMSSASAEDELRRDESATGSPR